MDYLVIILYPDSGVCGQSICRKSVDEVFISEDGTKTFHLMAIAFNVDSIIYIPRLLFLLQASFYGDKYTEAKHEGLTWSVLCLNDLMKGVALQKAPSFFLDVIAERTCFRFDAQHCLCFSHSQAEYDSLYNSLRGKFV